VPADLSTLAEPQFVLLTWSAGVAFVSGFVGLGRIVGPGFTWLTTSVAILISLAGVLSEGAWWARASLFLLLLALLWARNRPFSGGLQIAGGVGLFVQAALIGGPLPAVSATIALGGVTGEMLLGHWYLIDPRLPRAALRALAVWGILGMVSDSVVLASLRLPSGGATVAFWALAVTSVVLMTGVLGSLRYPAYSGVMAATGLSYLTVLTSLGAVFLGRALVAGLGPFGT
jgi:hypothetical protein